MPHNEHDIDEFDEDYKSKTQLKREMHELQDYAMRLVKLSKHQRKQLPLNEELLEAMVLADKIINKPEALSRHVRFISRMLSEMDLAPINQALDLMANKNQQKTRQIEMLEAYRDELIALGNEKIEEALANHPAMERQKLRQLVRQANKEKSAEKPGKGYKTLFTYLKEHML
ncbi:ribosome biogenesis factor YjgA [Thalassotalea fusca]